MARLAGLFSGKAEGVIVEANTPALRTVYVMSDDRTVSVNKDDRTVFIK